MRRITKGTAERRPHTLNIESVKSCLSEDTPTQHKELVKKLVKEKRIMAKQTLQTVLNYLYSIQVIDKERMPTKRDVGYYLAIPVMPHDIESLTKILKDRADIALNEKNEKEQILRALEGLYHAFDIILTTMVYPELIKYSINPNREQAKKRLNFVLKETIVPMFMRIADVSIIPAMSGKYKEHAKRTFEMMFGRGIENIGDSWIGAINTYLLKE